MASHAFNGFIGIPTSLANTLATPDGIITMGILDGKRPFITSFIVPSPPITATTSNSSSLISSVTSLASPTSFVVYRSKSTLLIFNFFTTSSIYWLPIPPPEMGSNINFALIMFKNSFIICYIARPGFYSFKIALWYTFADIFRACPRAKRRDKVYPKLLLF